MNRETYRVFALLSALFVAAVLPVYAGEEGDSEHHPDIRIDIDGLSELGELVSGIVEAVVGSIEIVADSLEAAGIHLDGLEGIHGHFMASNDDTGEASDIQESHSAESDVEIEVYNLSGSVKVIGWDKDEIAVTGTLGEDVERLKFDVDGDRAKIRVVIPERHRRSKRLVASHLTIQVPKNSSVEVETVSAPIRVSGIRGEDIELESVSGNIVVKDCTADIEMESISGSIVVEDCSADIEAQSVSGRVSIKGAPGSVEVSSVSGALSVEGVRKSLKAETVSGYIKVEAETLERCTLESVSGSIDFRGGIEDGGRLDVECFSGRAVLNLTNEVSGRYSIKTFSGRIDCDFGPEPQKTGRFSTEKELRFTHGDGNARVSVETFSGSVKIRRV